MKYLSLIIIFFLTSNVQAKNINISVKTDLDLNCKFEKVIIKKPGKDPYERETKNNPIHWLRKHGSYAVRNYINSLYKKNLRQGCSKCGYSCVVKSNKECPKCNYIMTTIYKFVVVNEDTDEFLNEDSYKPIYLESQLKYINNIILNFAEDVLGEGTRAHQVLKILTDPNESKDMFSSFSSFSSQFHCNGNYRRARYLWSV